METTFQTRAKIIEASALLNQHKMYYYTKKGITLFFEILCYLLFIAIIIVICFIPSDPIYHTENISETASFTTTLHMQEVSQLMNVIRVICALIALCLLFFGLLFGYIRRKNNRIRKAGELIDSALKTFV